MLSPSIRQVIHALLTRPPLIHASLGFSMDPFDLHVLGTPPAFILSQDQTLMFVCLPGQNSFLLLLRGCFRFLFLSGFLPASFLTGSSGFSFPSLYCFFFVSFSELFFRIFRAALLFICQGSVLSGNLRRLPTEKEGFEPSRRY